MTHGGICGNDLSLDYLLTRTTNEENNLENNLQSDENGQDGIDFLNAIYRYYIAATIIWCHAT